MSGKLSDIEPLVSSERPRQWRYTYSAGPVRSQFLTKLRDEGKITGTRCPQCGKVYVPARPVCISCFNNLNEAVEVSTRGKLLTYTVFYQAEPAHPLKPPFTYGIIQLDGADTGLVHFIGETDPEKLWVGMPVEAVFHEEREGNILDIAYFKPLSA